MEASEWKDYRLRTLKEIQKAFNESMDFFLHPTPIPTPMDLMFLEIKWANEKIEADKLKRFDESGFPL